jgi:hypothetical protein
MSSIFDGLSVYFKAGGTKLDIYSAGKNTVQGEYLNAFIDTVKVVHTYAELIVKEFPNVGLTLNITKLGLALNDLSKKSMKGEVVVINDVAAPLLAVTDIISDLALAAPNPQLKVAGLLGKGASMMANTALVAFGEKVVIPKRELGKEYEVEIVDVAGELATVSQVVGVPTKTTYAVANKLIISKWMETVTLSGAANAGMYTATEARWTTSSATTARAKPLPRAAATWSMPTTPSPPPRAAPNSPTA